MKGGSQMMRICLALAVFFSSIILPGFYPLEVVQANVSPNGFSLRFDGNGHTAGETPNRLKYAANAVIKLPVAGTMTKSAHHFDGWNTEPDRSGTMYMANDDYTIVADEVLYAQWSHGNYQIEYHGNGHDSGTPPSTLIKLHDDFLELAQPGTLARAGHQFVGWNSKPDGTGTMYRVGEEVKIVTDMVLYARWMPTGNDVFAPAAPTSLYVTNVQHNQLVLHWTEAKDYTGVTAYEVYRGTTLLAGNVSGTGYQVTNLASNTGYTFSVRAKDAAGNRSPASESYYVATFASPRSDILAPTVPSRFKVTGNRANGFNLSWGPSSDAGQFGTAGYRIFLGDSLIPLATVTSTRYTFNNLQPGTTYQIRVQAFDSSGNASALSAPFTHVTALDTVAPTAPNGLSYSKMTPSGFRLHWSPATDNVEVIGYEVYRNGQLVTKTAATFLDLTELQAATVYHLSVKAYDAAGRVSKSSSALRLMTYADSDEVAPDAPSGLNAYDILSTSFTVAWNSSADLREVAGYHVYVQEGDGETVLVGSTAVPRFRVTNLKPGTSYGVSVKAYDAAGPESNLSTATEPIEVVTEVDSGLPAVPAQLQAKSVVSDGFVLSWRAASDDIGVDYYEIFQDEQLIKTEHESLSLQIEGLTANTLYSMTVRAVDHNGFRSDRSRPLLVRTTDFAESGPQLLGVELPQSVNKSAILQYTLTEDAFVSVRLITENGKTVLTVTNNQLIRQGSHSLTIAMSAKQIKEGSYLLQLIARHPTTGKQTFVYQHLRVDRQAPTFSAFTASDINQPTGSSNLRLVVSERASIRIFVVSGNQVLRTIVNQESRNSRTSSFVWDGRDDFNRLLPDASYFIRAVAIDEAGNVSKEQATMMRIERAAPVIGNISDSPNSFRATGRSLSTIRFSLSEAANVTVAIVDSGGQEVRVLAANVARNAGANIITWNGRNTAGSLVAAGEYTFKINATDGSGKQAAEQSGTISLVR